MQLLVFHIQFFASMRKADYNRVLWFGAEQFPPIKTKWFFFSKRDVANFKPFDIGYQQLVCQTSASRDFIHEMSMLMQALPSHIRVLLQDYGVIVAPVGNVFETVQDGVDPTQEFRGIPDKNGWGQVLGFCDKAGHLISVPEFLLLDGVAVRNVDFASAFTHEVAHSMDEAFDLYSGSADFVEAWRKDKQLLVARSTAKKCLALEYYLADAPQGPSEVFAEISSNIIGKRMHKCDWRYWYRRFPRCYRLVSAFWRNLPPTLPVSRAS